MMFFTRRTIRSIVISRITVDGVVLICAFMFGFISLLKDLHLKFQKGNIIPKPFELHSKYYLFGCIGIVLCVLVVNFLLVRAYLKLGIRLKMLKEGGLTPQERGLVLGHAANGRSRTSTEIDMTRETSNTQEWTSKLSNALTLQSRPSDFPSV